MQNLQLGQHYNTKELGLNLSVYNENLIDFTKEPIFFGSGRNTQRYDVLKYKFFDTLRDKMLGQFWSPDEVDVARDKRDFHTMPENMKSTYTKVLQKLIFLDSVQGRGMLQTFGNLIVNPEFESVVTVWQTFELIHSKSYTHILRSVYDSPSEIFDGSFDIPELVELAKGISQSYDSCYSDATEYLNKCLQYPNHTNTDKLKESLLLLLLEINILEGVRFFSGFATIWSMHYSQGLMERTSLVLKLICRDELLHLQVTQFLLKILRTKQDEGFTEIYAKIEPQIPEIFMRAVDQEFQWVDCLFESGSFLGMTPELAKSYLKYIANKRIRALGFNGIFEGYGKNPIPWIDGYVHYDGVSTLPQESEIINYKLDTLDKSITDNELKELSKGLN